MIDIQCRLGRPRFVVALPGVSGLLRDSENDTPGRFRDTEAPIRRQTLTPGPRRGGLSMKGLHRD
jgi:hypothetical protein